jgi:FkbM family methyltransferase
MEPDVPDAPVTPYDRILSELQAVQQRLAFLERTAPGRGSTYIGDGLVLTRLSLAEMFYGDPAFIVSAKDRSIAPRLITDGVYERDSTYYVCRRVSEASRCVDVGANFGYYTIVMARHALKAQVIALEPVRESFELLRQNIRINEVGDRCVALNTGASDRARSLPMDIDPSLLGDAHVVGSERAAPGPMVEADFVSLDEVLSEFDHVCDFVKIDVEGHEPLVLRGMTTTIARNPGLSILVEWSVAHLQRAGHSPREFLETIAALDLRIHRVGPFGALTEIDAERLLKIDLTNIVLQRPPVSRYRTSV